MYAIDRRVYCKSLKKMGKISEANYVGNPRKAHYVVTFDDGSDFLTGPSDLRPADYQCDGCSGWRSGNPAAVLINPSDGVVEAIYCFPCVKQGERDEDRMRREEYAGI